MTAVGKAAADPVTLSRRCTRRRRLVEQVDRWAEVLGLSRAARRLAGWRLAPVLCYHRVSGETRPLCTPPDLFAAHLAHLAKHWRPLPLEELAGHLAAGREPPRGSVAVTFDDGYRDALTAAAPLLARYGIPATFFVTVSFADRGGLPWWERVADQLTRAGDSWRVTLDGRELLFPATGRPALEFAFRAVTRRLAHLPPAVREDALDRMDGGLAADDRERLAGLMMDWPEIRRLRAQGFSIGCHGLTHEPLKPDDPESLTRDLAEARDRLAREGAGERFPLAFPYAAGPPPPSPARRLLRELGFTCACTHASPATRGADPFALGRLGVEAESMAHFAAKLSGFNLLLKGWRASPP